MTFIHGVTRVARLASVALALAAGPALAQQQPTPAALATGKEIVALTGATTLFNPLIAGVIEQAKLLFLQQNPGLAKDLNDVAAKLRADLAPRFDEINTEVARLYATHFTEQELKDILAFYKTPTGTKMLSEQPKLVDDSLRFAQNWANKLSEEVVSMMRDEMKKKGHQL
jgi:hypothetical protein